MRKQRTWQLVFGAIMLLFLGLIYGWSVFVAPLEAEFAWARAQTSLVFTFSMVFFCVGGFMSGLLLQKVSYRIVLRVAAVLLLIGFFFSSRVQSLWGIYISYGVVCGTGVGLGYNCILSSIGKWFPEKPGFCSGMMLLGFGAGALLLGTGATALIEAFGWRTTFMLFAVAFALVIWVGAQLIKLPNEKQKAALDALVPAGAKAEGSRELPPGAMIKTPSCWLLFFWAILLSMIGLAVIGQSVPIAMELQLTAATATTISGMISVTNGLSRLLTGTVFDKLGKDKTMLLDNCLFVVALPLLYFALQMSSPVLLVAGFIVLGLAYGGVPPILSASVSRLFGKKHFAINFSIINFNLIFAAIAGPAIASAVLQQTNSYVITFLYLLVPCFLGMLLLPLMRKYK